MNWSAWLHSLLPALSTAASRRRRRMGINVGRPARQPIRPERRLELERCERRDLFYSPFAGAEPAVETAVEFSGDSAPYAAGLFSGAEGEAGANAQPAFSLVDVNPASPRFNQGVSPRDYLEQVSAWYFAHST